jgi:hypothetical protein
MLVNTTYGLILALRTREYEIITKSYYLEPLNS